MARATQQDVDNLLRQLQEAGSNVNTREKVIDVLIQRGNIVEGVNDTGQQVPQTSNVPRRDIFESQRQAEINLGIRGSVVPTEQEAKQIEKKGTLQKIAGVLGIENIGKRIGSELVRLTPEGRELERLREQGLINEEIYKDIVTGGVSNKQAIGSALSLAANLALPGAGGALLKGGSNLARAAGATRAATNLARGADAASKVNLGARIVRGRNVAETAKNVGKAVGKSTAIGVPFGLGGALQAEPEVQKISDTVYKIGNETIDFLGVPTEKDIREAKIFAQREGDDGVGIREVLGKTLQSALIAGAFPLAGAATRAIGKGIAKTAKLSAQALSRTPEKAIQFAIENPQLASRGVQRAKNDPNLVFKVAREAELATNAIKTKRDKSFARGLAKVDKQLTGKTIDPQPFNEKLEDAFRQFDMLGKNGRISRDGIISDTREIADLERILERMGRQKDLSPSGYWKLKRFINNKYRPTASNEYNALITKMDNDLRDVMVQEIPQMDKLFRNFENDSAVLGILKKELGLQGQTKGVSIGDAEIIVNNSSKRVMNALRRAGRDNQELLGELVKEMEKRSGKELTADLMGLYFKEFLPPIGFNFLGAGVAGTGAAITGTALTAGVPLIAASSPRAVGAISRTVGRAQQGLRNAAPAIDAARTVGRQAIFGGLRNVTGE